MKPWVIWSPCAAMALGALFTVGLDTQRELQLRAALGSAIPATIVGQQGTDVTLSDDEVQVAGMTEYLLRNYQPSDTAASATLPFSVYVGYYDSQIQGKTIHSPKNCLPGAGWEALASAYERVETADGPVRVNRYLLQNGDQQALVLYWYQGRGRVESNEYLVKWDLLRDAALRQRSEEALVRVVVPLESGTEDQALALATSVASLLMPALYSALPD